MIVLRSSRAPSSRLARATRRAVLGALALAALGLMPAATAAGADQAAGDELYAAGRFAEALEAYRSADATGGLDGLGLYRFAFCLESVERNTLLSQEVYGRSAEALAERTRSDDAELEHHFYLVNARLNLEQPDLARAAGEAAIARIEAGAFAHRRDGRAFFRMGKIYRDSGQGAKSLDPFGRALEAWERDGDAPLPYVERIARFALDQGDPELSIQAGALLARMGRQQPLGPRVELAAAVRRGDLDAASRLIASGRLPLARTDLRYLEHFIDWGLRRTARDGAVATALPDGRPLLGLSSAEVQAEMTASAARAFAALDRPPLAVEARRMEMVTAYGTAGAVLSLASGAPRPLLSAAATAVADGVAPLTLDTAGWRQALTSAERAVLRDESALFLGLGLEAVIRGADLRVWATQGRFAPLVFKDWQQTYRQKHRLPMKGAPVVRDGDASGG